MNVVEFTGTTVGDIDPDKVIEASKGQLESVIILGVDKETGDYYFVSSTKKNETLWIVEKFKQYLMEIDEE